MVILCSDVRERETEIACNLSRQTDSAHIQELKTHTVKAWETGMNQLHHCINVGGYEGIFHRAKFLNFFMV